MQERLSRANKIAWETKAYQAWTQHLGEPSEHAHQLKTDPRYPLRHWLKYIGDPTGKRVLNLLGSHGKKAICLALLGADVTVVDISEENQLYATQVAASAEVVLHYICSDVLNIPNEDELGEFDIVLMEFGILHYFSDLNPLFSLVRRRLSSGGRLILTDFHPFSRKVLNNIDGNWQLKPDGNYFDNAIHEGGLAYVSLLPEKDRADLPNCLLRHWTAGEVITSVAAQGLFIRTFEEIASSTKTIPEFYTIVADKESAHLSPLYSR
ncbi:class I SAM-dependent methyltransferase [Alicyclobacillus curvatus]|nr:class I SAM-dependent methyltransferase [Alicyclobacillus curvatus]